MVTLDKFLIVICLCRVCVKASSIQIPSSASAVNGQTEYILFTDHQTWNTARKVCKAYGATLAIIDSQTKLDRLQELANGAWSSNWGDVWTGLHRESDNSLRYDDDLCSLFDLAYSGTDIFRAFSHYSGTYDFDDERSEKCYKVDDTHFAIDLRPCDIGYKFVCEKQVTGPCQYTSLDTDSLVIPLPESSAPVCQSLCEQQSGCYLVTNASSYCVLLTVPATDPSVYTKDCMTVSIETLDTNHFRGSDDSYETATPCSTSTATTVAPSPSGPFNITVLLAQDICPLQETVTIDCSAEYTTVTSSPSTVTSIQTTSLTLTSTVTQYITVPETVSDVFTVSASCLTPTATVTETVNNDVIHSESCVDGVPSFATLTTTETMTSTEIYSTCSLPSTPSLMASTTSSTFAADISSSVISVSSTSFAVVSSAAGTYIYPSSTLSPDCSCLPNLGMPSSVALYVNDTSTLKQTTICKSYNLTDIDTASLEAALSSIVKELTLETKNLSSSIRKKTSAHDSRKSSTGIGYSAIGIMAVPFILLLLFDSRKMFRDLRYTASGSRKNLLP